MFSVVSAIRNTVPITQFNRGLAGQIFEDVKATGAKVVMKNNSAECVLLAPDEYLRIMDELNDARLAALAAERALRLDPSTLIPEEKVWERLGITDDDLAMAPEVEFE
jgi:PHD/YefM family antitoxin component YafN of YafNO toxin-antitoxin module